MAKRRVLPIVFGSLFGGCCLLLGFGYAWFLDLPLVWFQAGRVEREYRAAGLPWTAEDVTPDEPLPEVDNAA
ncbi:MAG: hypothetical protein MH204_11010, partial [Fimbriimonadaceae bacterium]|nr:hypothetical protein [Fimbriimonadaceae bacterium]